MKINNSVMRAAVACAIVLACGCGSRHIKEAPDKTSPRVATSMPAGGTTAVKIDTVISATFTETMDSSTITAATFQVVSGATGTVVSGTVVYDYAGNTATFTPSSSLAHETVYTARITADVKDLAGNPLPSASNWSFTTIPASGAPDRSFGSGGSVRTPVGNGDDSAMAIAVQNDGKIVAAGYSTVVTVITATQASYDTYFTLVRYNANGALDTAFGAPLNVGGKITDFKGKAFSIALQPDGKILAAGASGSGSDFLIARYNSDGQIDSSFGVSGQAVIDMGGGKECINALALQSDGKVLVAGYEIPDASLTGNLAMARVNPDGTLDNSFNGTGKLVSSAFINASARAVQVLPDGKFVLSGTFQNANGLLVPFLMRYDQEGSPDVTFNGTGTVAGSHSQNAMLSDLAVLPDGKLLVAGVTVDALNNTSDIFLTRYGADGLPDTTFGQDGTGSVYTDFNAGEEGAAALRVDPEGNLVVAAQYKKTSGQPQTYDFAVFRYTADGAPDLAFGNGFGMIRSDFGGNFDDFAYSLAIQPDGKIVVAGSAWNGLNFDIGLCRYWP